MKLSVIFGTRPEGIKLAPVVLALRADRRLACHVCVTGQHREMLDQVLEVFQIRPDADLALMRPNQSLASLSAAALEAVDRYLEGQRPSLVLAQGDTTTVLCTALACFYRRIPFGHVEAGLRTGDLSAPWPEEANRVLTSRLAALHFAPTPAARENLLREGVPEGCIHVTGNTVVDALLHTLEQVRRDPPRIAGLPADLQPGKAGARRASVRPGCVLITGHRRESFGAGFESICRAIADLARQFPAVQFVYPVHLNPNVREPVHRLLGVASADGSPAGNIHLLAPQPYREFVSLMDGADLILTDSGGIQEEAPSLGKPVFVMRDVTERPEAVAAGVSTLVGTTRDGIVAALAPRLAALGRGAKPGASSETVAGPNPDGDGKAAGRIAAVCAEFLARNPASA